MEEIGLTQPSCILIFADFIFLSSHKLIIIDFDPTLDYVEYTHAHTHTSNLYLDGYDWPVSQAKRRTTKLFHPIGFWLWTIDNLKLVFISIRKIQAQIQFEDRAKLKLNERNELNSMWDMQNQWEILTLNK